MLACDWNGHSYSASTIVAALAMAASALPFFTGSWRAMGVAARMWSYSAAGSGNGATAWDQVTISARAARMASHSPSDHTKALFPDHVRAGDVSDRSFVDSDWHAAGNRGADHASVQHTGQANIRDELMPCEDFFRDVSAPRGRGTDDAVVARGLRLGVAAGKQSVAIDAVPEHRHIELPLADQLAKADLPGGFGYSGDHSVPHPQRIDRNPEMLRGQIQQDAPRLQMA